MRDIRAAAVIFRSFPGEVDRNLAAMAEWIRIAARRGAELICFPEMNITGYSTAPEIASAAQPIPGPVTDRVVRWAAGEGVMVLAGAAERGGDGRLYASHFAAAPDGTLRIYRKLHIAPPEQGLFSPGDQVPLFTHGGLNFGIQLCYDAHFPELTTLMALEGADAVVLPHASPRGTPAGKMASWLRHLTARAFDNGVYILACNATGTTAGGLSFPGVALAIDPSGRVIAEHLSEDEGLLVIDLKAKALAGVRRHKMRYFLPNRRPDLFRRIIEAGADFPPAG